SSELRVPGTELGQRDGPPGTRIQQVLLKDGRTLSCDLFLVAAGITPNVDLAREAGLAVNRGVVVDHELRTSDPAIYAAGDVAECQGTVLGLWPAAAEQAQVAAANALGDRTSYEPAPPATMLKVVGVELTSIGRSDPRSPEEIEVVLEEPVEHRYRKLVIADGRIAGAILFGYPLLAPVVTNAMKNNVDVSLCLAALRAGDWDVLGSLPAGAPPEPAAAPATPAALAPRRVAPPTPVAAAASDPARVEPAPIVIPAAPRLEAASPAPVASTPQQPPRQVRLHGESGRAQGIVFTVDAEGATLGRTPDNAIAIADSRLSRQHARIELRDGGFWLLDLESTNGTFINYQRLMAPHRLRTGDVIGVGGSRLVVAIEE
ncbi:MAG: FHA domain-containing protein, partial [Dehalococcoidia bacterium]